MAFFVGAPDGSTAGRDDLAREIAANALKFTEERYREKDMQSYMFLFMLEVSNFAASARSRLTSAVVAHDVGRQGGGVLSIITIVLDEIDC